ncbi:MAG: transketolase [Ignavibacteria bacterium RIFCSPLOWO2_02_FULL_55_14]|nr:MAG: transketolase [Ignavibacteria bacterium RIFCSPLOWO2_02_FULL_55_14]
MPLIDSKTGDTRRTYSIAQLESAARLMRAYDLVCLAAAGSGHSGGTLSIMDIAAALYLKEARLDPQQPDWKNRDRIVWSVGHKAPSLYIAMGMAGFFDPRDVVTLRKLGSPFQGHPHWLKIPGIEASTGSLGQGLSIAVGMALGLRLDKSSSRVYCIMGDGEQQEGQIWEAAMEAGHYQLDNLCAIIDRNRLQIDGRVDEVMKVESLRAKYEAFGWNVVETDGHTMDRIVDAFNQARSVKGRPTVILAETVKGKGVDFMENVAGWHGKSPSMEELTRALGQLGLPEPLDVDTMMNIAREFQKKADQAMAKKMPAFGKATWWNADEMMRVDMQPTRKGFGTALKRRGGDARIVCLGLDISGSITISDFYASNPERKDRWFSMGIAEQSAICVAAGLAREGRIPVLGTYGTFAAGRCLDQIRTTVCYGELNVLIAGAHGGVSVGPDGATHQSLEDLFQICGLPNIRVSVPCDNVETEKATEHMLFNAVGPKYIRFAREATPVVTTAATPFKFGVANIIRFRGIQPRFIDAFETRLASEVPNESEHLSIIACGPMVPEAMRAAVILKNVFGYETRVINMHTLKPLDAAAVIRGARETGVVITAEEHQIGGLADRVCRIITESYELYRRPVITGSIGVNDRFGESGAPWELIKEFGVSAEHIAQKAHELVQLKSEELLEPMA